MSARTLARIALTLLLVPGASAARAQNQAVTPCTCVTGKVLDVNGQVRNGVAVRLQPEAADQPGRLELADKDGNYRFQDVPAGSYSLEVVGDGYGSPRRQVTVNAGEETQANLVGQSRMSWALGLTLLVVALFVAGLLSFRHHNVVHTTRALLLAQLDNLRTRIPLESDAARPREVQELLERIGDIRNGVRHELTWMEWLFWSRGREIGAWVQLHEVERQLVSYLVPEPRVFERAMVVEAQLRGVTGVAATAAADRLRATLQQIMAATGNASRPAPPHLFEHLKQQLAEGLSLLSDDDDTKFAGLMEWHNKTMWLVYLSLLSIVVLGVMFHNEGLFLVGAVGGLMSRMARSLFREDVPTDYGASWTTLFLSPLLGAISAWMGIALIVWLTEFEMLGPMFKRIVWNSELDGLMIATAFTLGFSERLFTSLLSKVEGRVTEELDRASTRSAVPPPIVVNPSQTPTTTEPSAPPAASPTDRILAELDLKAGERAIVVGNGLEEVRAKIVGVVGADAFTTAAIDRVSAADACDAILLAGAPPPDALAAVAASLAAALRPDGRVVIVGQSPAALFEADAATQRAQAHAGPAALRELFISVGLRAQEPPVVLEGTDPVQWLVSFVKSTISGSDR